MLCGGEVAPRPLPPHERQALMDLMGTSSYDEGGMRVSRAALQYLLEDLLQACKYSSCADLRIITATGGAFGKYDSPRTLEDGSSLRSPDTATCLLSRALEVTLGSATASCEAAVAEATALLVLRLSRERGEVDSVLESPLNGRAMVTLFEHNHAAPIVNHLLQVLYVPGHQAVGSR
jgi:hypothetical protein